MGKGQLCWETNDLIRLEPRTERCLDTVVSHSDACSRPTVPGIHLSVAQKGTSVDYLQVHCIDTPIQKPQSEATRLG